MSWLRACLPKCCISKCCLPFLRNAPTQATMGYGSVADSESKGDPHPVALMIQIQTGIDSDLDSFKNDSGLTVGRQLYEDVSRKQNSYLKIRGQEFLLSSLVRIEGETVQLNESACSGFDNITREMILLLLHQKPSVTVATALTDVLGRLHKCPFAVADTRSPIVSRIETKLTFQIVEITDDIVKVTANLICDNIVNGIGATSAAIQYEMTYDSNFVKQGRAEKFAGQDFGLRSIHVGSAVVTNTQAVKQAYLNIMGDAYAV